MAILNDNNPKQIKSRVVYMGSWQYFGFSAVITLFVSLRLGSCGLLDVVSHSTRKVRHRRADRKEESVLTSMLFWPLMVPFCKHKSRMQNSVNTRMQGGNIQPYLSTFKTSHSFENRWLILFEKWHLKFRFDLSIFYSVFDHWSFWRSDQIFMEVLWS